MARPLKRWLCRNRNNPYPTKNEKSTLAIDASMTITQVSNWFANARRRLKTTVTHPQMSWASRISLYNSFIVGNQELLSLSSDDTLWDADPGSNVAGTMRSVMPFPLYFVQCDFTVEIASILSNAISYHVLQLCALAGMYQ